MPLLHRFSLLSKKNIQVFLLNASVRGLPSRRVTAVPGHLSPAGRLMLSSLSSPVCSPALSQPSQGAVGRAAGCGPSQPGRRGTSVPKGSGCDDHLPQREPSGPPACLDAPCELPGACLPCRRFPSLHVGPCGRPGGKWDGGKKNGIF